MPCDVKKKTFHFGDIFIGCYVTYLSNFNASSDVGVSAGR